MPVKRCQKDGKKGWKWGDNGTCYTGDGGKAKAEAQAAAAYSSGYTSKAEQLDIVRTLVVSDLD